MRAALYAATDTTTNLLGRFPVLVSGTLAALLVLGLSVLGPAATSSRAVDDTMMRHVPVTLPPSRILMVGVPTERLRVLRDPAHADHAIASDQMDAAITRLRELGAHSIALAFLPAADLPLMASGAPGMDLVLGRRLAPGTELDDLLAPESGLEEIEEALRPHTESIGLLEPIETVGGIAREHRLYRQIGPRIQPSFELLSAGRLTPTPISLSGPIVQVDFRAGAHRIPSLSFERVVEGDLLEDIVRDRLVLIGEGEDRFARGFSTPSTGEARSMSELEYRAHVLDTLVRGTPIHRTGAPIGLAFALATGLIGAWIGARQSLRVQLLATVAIAVLFSCLAASALALFAIQLPIVAPTAAHALALVLVASSRAAVRERSLRRAIRSTSALTRTLPESNPTIDSESPWARAERVLRSTVGFERVTFFALEDDEALEAEWLRPVGLGAFSHSVEPDLRFDLSQGPFPLAIREGSAIALDAVLLEPASGRSVQFLVPLFGSGSVFGFCLVEHTPPDLEEEEALLIALREIAAPLGDLLTAWRREITTPLGRRVRAWQPDAKERSDRVATIERGIEMLHRQLVTTRQVLDDGSVATAVLDPAGCIRHVNERMNTIASELGLSLDETDLAESVARLSGIDLHRARGLCRQLIVEHRKAVLPLASSPGENARTLHVTPLAAPRSERDDPARPGPVQAILFEIIDDEVAHRFHHHHAQIAPIARRASLDLEALSELTKKVASADEPDFEELLGLTRAARRSVETLEKTHARMPQLGDPSPVLIEASAPLEHSAEAQAPECRQRDIALVVDRSERPIFIEAPEAAFYDLLDACLSLLIRDATDASTIVLHVSEGPSRIEYELRNEGYGMSSNVLQRGLADIDDDSLLDLTRIRRALPEVERSGAELSITSEVGEGIRIEISMPRAL